MKAPYTRSLPFPAWIRAPSGAPFLSAHGCGTQSPFLARRRFSRHQLAFVLDGLAAVAHDDRGAIHCSPQSLRAPFGAPSFCCPSRAAASLCARSRASVSSIFCRAALCLGSLAHRRTSIHGRLPLRKGFRRGWHSGLGCCHPFGLNDHRSLASMRSAGRLPIIFSGSWPWESDGLRRPRSDRSCHPQRSPSQLVEAFQGRIDLIRPKPSIDLPENALAPPSSAQLTPPHGRSRHGSAGPRGSVPACSRPRPRRR